MLNIQSGCKSITAGTTQTQNGATALTGGVNLLTVGTAGDGGRLPQANAGDRITVINVTGGKFAYIYPDNGAGTAATVASATGGKIDEHAANGAIVLAGNETRTFICTVSATQPVAPDGTGGVGAQWRSEGGERVLYTNVAVSADHENTTDAALFDKSFTLPANTLKAGDVLRIRGAVLVTDQNSTDTLTLDLMIGGLAGTVIATTGAVDVADSDVGYFDVVLQIRTAGATGTAAATGTAVLGVPGTAAAEPFIKTSFTIDTTAAQQIGIRADWSVAHADNEANLELLVVEKL